jgi:hypothetical protein
MCIARIDCQHMNDLATLLFWFSVFDCRATSTPSSRSGNRFQAPRSEKCNLAKDGDRPVREVSMGQQCGMARGTWCMSVPGIEGLLKIPRMNSVSCPSTNLRIMEATPSCPSTGQLSNIINNAGTPYLVMRLKIARGERLVYLLCIDPRFEGLRLSPVRGILELLVPCRIADLCTVWTSCRQDGIGLTLHLKFEISFDGCMQVHGVQGSICWRQSQPGAEIRFEAARHRQRPWRLVDMKPASSSLCFRRSYDSAFSLAGYSTVRKRRRLP